MTFRSWSERSPLRRKFMRLAWGCAVEEIGAAWMRAIANPIRAGRRDVRRPARKLSSQGDELRQPGGGLASLPVPISTPGFDCRALSHRDALHHARSRDRHSQHGDLSRRAESDRPAGRAHVLADRRRGRLPALGEVSRAARTDAVRDCDRLRARGDLHRAAEIRRPMWTNWTSPAALAGAPIRTAKCVTIDLEVPADAEIVIEGLIDPDLLEPEGPFGESNGYVALEDYNMSCR